MSQIAHAEPSPRVVATSKAPGPRAMRFFNPFVSAMLRSPLHACLSGQVLLLTLTGKRSGRAVTLPVGYIPDGETLLVISQHADQKRWWRNLRGGAPVTLHLRGKRVAANAEAIDAPLEVAAEIERLIARLGAREASARLYLSLDTTPPPTRDELAQALNGVVLVRITPNGGASTSSAG